jgi:hypothetical protein
MLTHLKEKCFHAFDLLWMSFTGPVRGGCLCNSSSLLCSFLNLKKKSSSSPTFCSEQLILFSLFSQW